MATVPYVLFLLQPEEESSQTTTLLSERQPQTPTVSVILYCYSIVYCITVLSICDHSFVLVPSARRCVMAIYGNLLCVSPYRQSKYPFYSFTKIRDVQISREPTRFAGHAHIQEDKCDSRTDGQTQNYSIRGKFKISTTNPTFSFHPQSFDKHNKKTHDDEGGGGEIRTDHGTWHIDTWHTAHNIRSQVTNTGHCTGRHLSIDTNRAHFLAALAYLGLFVCLIRTVRYGVRLLF